MLVSLISQPCVCIFQPNFCYYLSYVSSTSLRIHKLKLVHKLITKHTLHSRVKLIITQNLDCCFPKMWPDLLKAVLYTHSFKTHFLSPFVSYINGPTAHVLNTAEAWTGCFHSGLFFKPVWHPQVLVLSLNGPRLPLASRQLTVNRHMTGWCVCPWIWLFLLKM